MTIAEIAARIRALVPDLDIWGQRCLRECERTDVFTADGTIRSSQLTWLGNVVVAHADVLLRDPAPVPECCPLPADVNAHAQAISDFRKACSTALNYDYASDPKWNAGSTAADTGAAPAPTLPRVVWEDVLLDGYRYRLVCTADGGAFEGTRNCDAMGQPIWQVGSILGETTVKGLIPALATHIAALQDAAAREGR